ncbi:MULTISPECIES: bifunctional protein-serine/threonine kinase/phosphatase [Pseudomonas]|jgi:serine/threonine protein phosphatase PrpC|uniref:Bifunctional protein-serine/threonine kinase/phosphatase n=2 Tax=Pseudomonas TaxID=286 RepID=A0ABU5P846_9PSED|nr:MULTISPECIES: bifunctional protein-serine/threonine kinase/phosphatase [unclassified Pseudomonas]MBU0808351.1 bifunctional protein-serine/threonine kinase/phosphatase [Gammaproteobacteria bacterium]MBU0885038.1 bifunctional protein-serine/threonine kinase/phosphatase [Gammaproteobacteria bacterium]MBU1859074.1 bifunctional protein-serine/threonine kinase/phosphatase [Gammaproteobacteria bacterium]MDD2161155.1 bifunctional protein-serine/threonine kinase/phosphatase [Pseudomonas sp. MIL19]ME
MGLHLSYAESSASGPRVENQDAVRLVTPAPSLAGSKGYLFALADGVSQCADGGLAARSTLQALAHDYYATPETWGVAQALDRLLLAQNRWLHANGGGQPLLTTLSALVMRGRHFTLAHIGDCRVYRWFAGQLQRISEDHVWGQPGMQHVLKRAMGLEQHVVVDYLDGELRLGESFLLVSDGIWATLSEASIAGILRDEQQLQAASQALVSAAHQAGSQDNASAVLVRVDELGETSLGDALGQLDQWPLPPLLKPGQVFEGWQVEALVGQNRQSVLYRVRDNQQQPWLLKTLPASRDSDSTAGNALLQEEWFLRRVAGRYFPEVHHANQRQHLYYLMREHPGITLAEHYHVHGNFGLNQWLGIASLLLRALGMLHRRNIVHRDIKPENLLLNNDGELRVLDFGLAYCPGLSNQALGELPGTPSFIAPEAYAGAPPSAAQDLYSAGVTLYYLLTGHYPYGEIEAFQRPRFGTPVAANRYRPDLPEWLVKNLDKALTSDPTQRFETAEEWLLALQQGEHQPSTRHRPLLEREPLKVWRALALASLLVNGLLLIWLLHA